MGRGLWWCLWSILSPETMLRSLEAICKSMTHVPTDEKGRRSYFCCGIDECGLTVEKAGQRRTICHNPYILSTPKSNSLDRKLSKRILKNCHKDALHNWWPLAGVWVEKDSVFFKGLSTGSLIMLQRVYGQHRLEFFSFLILLGTETKE